MPSLIEKNMNETKVATSKQRPVKNIISLEKAKKKNIITNVLNSKNRAYICSLHATKSFL